MLTSNYSCFIRFRYFIANQDSGFLYFGMDERAASVFNGTIQFHTLPDYFDDTAKSKPAEKFLKRSGAVFMKDLIAPNGCNLVMKLDFTSMASCVAVSGKREESCYFRSAWFVRGSFLFTWCSFESIVENCFFEKATIQSDFAYDLCNNEFIQRLTYHSLLPLLFNLPFYF